MSEISLPQQSTMIDAGWIGGVVTALRQRETASQAGLDALRDRLVALVNREDGPLAAAFAQAGDAAKFRRHPLAAAELAPIGCSALMMYWPKGYSTLPHDHAGLWGIELVIDGALQIDEFVRVGERARPTLALARSLYLGIGDAAVFSGDAYVHRCRNLSGTQAALSLHVYGGSLDAYRAFLVDTSGRYRTREEIARSDAAIG